MAPSNALVVLLTIVTLAVPQRNPLLDEAIRQLGDRKEDVRAVALLGISDRGPAAATLAAPAVIEMMSRYGWHGRDFDYACDILSDVADRALPVLPLLARWSVESWEDKHDPTVVRCAQRILEHVGVEKMPQVIRSTVPEARRWWSQSHNPAFTIERTNLARDVYAGAVQRWGATAIPYVEEGLRDRDPFVRAEAAAAVQVNLDKEAARLLPILNDALSRERSPWPRAQIKFVIDYLESLKGSKPRG